MKVGILGSGVVGQTLGAGFIKHGHEVMIGTRDVSKLAEWKEQNGELASLGSFEDAAKFSDVIVLAVKGNIAKDALALAGSANINGKTILDATNPIADVAPEDGTLQFFTDSTKSLMEQLQEAYPEANFVKAFSCIGSPNMVNPEYEGGKPSMFIAGNNEDAKKITSEIVEMFGFEVEDMGSSVAARGIEPLCILWCIPGFIHNQWTHAFKLLKK
jgi:predicted dinucleotide-binding enzyme